MRTRHATVAFGMLAVGAVLPPVARADFKDRLRVATELGAGAMLARYQRHDLGYHVVTQAALLFEVKLVRWVYLDAVGSVSWFPTGDAEDGLVYTVGAGARVVPLDVRLGALFVDAHAGYARTGPIGRFTWDAGAGFAFHVGGVLDVGPFARYQQVVPTSDDRNAHARFLVGGVEVALHFPRPVAAAPLGDRDNDGVRDDLDRCPDTDPRLQDDPNRPGCPIGDTDGDGILDRDDECPEQTVGAHPHPAMPGCPGPAPIDVSQVDARIEEGQIRIDEPVFFAFGEDAVLPESFPVLEAVARVLREHPEIERVSIEGHTDDVGTTDFNQALSERRAQNVLEWLATHGIERTRLVSQGFGLTRPIVSGSEPSARQQNRRVEFVIVTPESPPP